MGRFGGTSHEPIHPNQETTMIRFISYAITAAVAATIAAGSAVAVTPPKVVTKTVTKEVPVTPQACLLALDDADHNLSALKDVLSASVDVSTAIQSEDFPAGDVAIARMQSAAGSMVLGSVYYVAETDCRSSAKPTN
jgi:hypothetical protein